jgi:hypothetical protein
LLVEVVELVVQQQPLSLSLNPSPSPSLQRQVLPLHK